MAEKLDAALKTVAKGAIFVFAGVFISKALTYVYRVMMARMLGPEQYGLFSLAFSAFMMSMVVAKLGVPNGINRFVSKYRGTEDEARVKGAILSGLELTMPASLFMGAALFLGAPLLATQVFHEPATAPLIRIFAVTLPIRTFLKDMMEVFKAFQRMDFFSLVEHVVQSVAMVGMTYVLITAGYGVIGAAAAYAMSMAVAGALAVYLMQAKVFPLFGGVDAVRNHRELLHYSLPLLASGMIGSISGWIDNFMLGWFPNTVAADVGIYNAALPTGRLISAFAMPFSMILFPVITSHLARDERTEALQIAASTVRWTLAVTFPATLLLILFAGPVLRVLFGPEYVAGSFVLAIVAAAAFFSAILSPIGQFLKAMDRTKIIMFNSAVGTALNVPLNLLLIPRYGIAGAGIATTASITAGTVLGVVEVVYLMDVRPPVKGIVPPLIAAAVASGASYVALHAVFEVIPWWAVVPGGVLFGVVYLTTFLLAGGLREEDVLILKAIERRSGVDLEPLRKLVRRLSRA